MNKEIEIPEGYEAIIEGNKVILERKESEDEKIRKSIIHILQVGGYMPDEEKKKAFAYLERQKYEYEIFEPIESTLEYKAGFRAGIESERQKEQKPVQDKEEREYVRTLKSLIADFLRDKEDVNRGYYQDIYDWLDGRHIEQKLSTAKDIAAAYQMGLAEGRKEQKPAEWSEEDEKNLKLAYDLLVNGVEADRRYPELISWLKSLRPSWKPSEEQMKALKIACTIREGERNYYLHTLLDDLEKLYEIYRFRKTDCRDKTA